MNQFLFKSMSTLLLLCSVSFFSCKNSQPDSKPVFDGVTANSCLLNCATKEKACWDEYDKCKSKAVSEEQVALNICNHVPPQNRWECKSKAVSDFRDKVEQCEKNLRASLAEIKNCRDACSKQFTFKPDNTK